MYSRNRHSIPSNCFLACVVINSASLVTANIVAVKLVSIFGFVVPGGAIVYPINFIVDDVITEVYGYRAARKVIWFSFLANFLFVAVAVAVQHLPAAPFWDAQESYERILGYAPRILIAAFLSYLVGSFANAAIMSRMKLMTNGKALWARTIGSTFVGQGLDSAIFVVAAFAGSVAWAQIGQIVLTVWLFKTLYEASVTPLTYMVTSLIKKKEGLDTFDENVNYNPFLLS